MSTSQKGGDALRLGSKDVSAVEIKVHTLYTVFLYKFICLHFYRAARNANAV